MTQPLVAVSTDVRQFENYTWHAAPRQYLEAAIAQAGVIPVLVPSFGERIDLESLIARVDGVMLTGSKSNVDPSLYGGEASEENGPYIANGAMRSLRAVYNHARKTNPDLPPVNPVTAIDWNTEQAVNYTFRQDPGAKNSMGNVKINFHNTHAVYLHDTPQNHHFSRTRRDFSSGCIRLERPEDFARLLLDMQTDGGAGQLDALLTHWNERWIRLDRSLPVYLLYFTTWVEEDGTVRFHHDVYGRDEQLAPQVEVVETRDRCFVRSHHVEVEGHELVEHLDESRVGRERLRHTHLKS